MKILDVKRAAINFIGTGEVLEIIFLTSFVSEEEWLGHCRDVNICGRRWHG